MRKGFTLVEILVVIAVLGIMGLVTTEIFVRSLRGSEKAKVLGSIKQNGQAVLERIDKEVRSADKVVCSTDRSLVTVKNGIYLRYRFYLGSPSGNGAIKQDNPQQTTTLDQFLIDVCNDDNPQTSSVVTLTDDNPASGVFIERGEFKRYKLAGYKDGVDIQFSLKPAVNAPSVIQIDPVEFKTSVTLR